MTNNAENDGRTEGDTFSGVEHVPVLAETLTQQVAVPLDGTMVDVTIGQGGHSLLFGQTLSESGIIIGLDVDDTALERSRNRLKPLACKVLLIRSNFSNLSACLEQSGVDTVDFILADLGYSSDQLSDQAVGLSFQTDMPLDMRIDRSLNTTAADIVNTWDETHLADTIYQYGEDRASRRIARFIVRHRQEEPIITTGQLANIVCRALYRPGQKKRQRIHPATRTFQALRIAVNHELDNLQVLLNSAPALLKTGGRLAVISFHSLEDRLVKVNFRENAKSGLYRVVTPKPIGAGEEEIEQNHRARSAKLRIAEKL